MDLKRANDLQLQLIKLDPILDSEVLKQKWDELSKMADDAKFISDQLRLMCLSSKRHIVHRIKKIRSSVYIIEKEDTKLSDLQSLKIKDEEVAPGVRLQALEVPTVDFIPDTPLYRISSTGEWGIRVMGVPLIGQIGEISNGKKHLICRARVHDIKSCPKHHAGDPPHWLPSMFMHCTQPLSTKNVNMRHVGNRSTLSTDIKRVQTAEIERRRAQLAHDLLIQLVLSKIETK